MTGTAVLWLAFMLHVRTGAMIPTPRLFYGVFSRTDVFSCLIRDHFSVALKSGTRYSLHKTYFKCDVGAIVRALCWDMFCSSPFCQNHIFPEGAATWICAPERLRFQDKPSLHPKNNVGLVATVFQESSAPRPSLLYLLLVALLAWLEFSR